MQTHMYRLHIYHNNADVNLKAMIPIEHLKTLSILDVFFEVSSFHDASQGTQHELYFKHQGEPRCSACNFSYTIFL